MSSKKKKTTPFEVFAQHKSLVGDTPGYCGFYWHSTRIAKKGTDYIFDVAQKQFQSAQSHNQIDWKACRNILFDFKKTIDQQYRNMFWHFRNGGECEKCVYWDDVYRMHLANVDSASVSQPEITDEEMLEAAMAVDGSC